MTNKEWQQRYEYYRNERRPGQFWKSFYDYRHHCMGGHWYLSEQTNDGKVNFEHMVANGFYDMNAKPTKYNVISDNLFVILPARLVYKAMTFLFKICIKSIWFLFKWALKGCFRVIKYIFNYANQEHKEDKRNNIQIRLTKESNEYCPYCKNQISPGTKFCPFCGRKLR